MRYLSVLFSLSLLFFTPAHGEIVARHTLAKGAILTLDDVREDRFVQEDETVFKASYHGLSLKRMVYANQVISLTYLREPDIVRRNKLVQMVYEIGNLQIRTQGRALAAGAKGEVVAVMNVSSRQIVQGEVIGPDLVRLF